MKIRPFQKEKKKIQSSIVEIMCIYIYADTKLHEFLVVVA